ncbi:MAG: sigma 54-interacting transcriptional regulator [Polyangiaceae bacterium]
MAAPDDALTATAGGDPLDGSSGEVWMSVLRWVFPQLPAPTVLSNIAVTIGREAGCATRLDTSQVSRRHAEVKQDGDEYKVFDLASKNGVFVNGERETSATLRTGDVLRLGDCVAVVERVTAAGLAGFDDLGHGIFGGASLRRVVQRAKQAARGNLNILLQGETGTGKERFARALHAFSGRSGPFLAVNAAAYHESTAAGELFGYRKGAFTGAERANLGHVRAAHRGTLLLDEILDMPLELQAKLLRVIEQREVLPLGETEATPVDVAFVSASQVPLADAVANGRFRSDLRARLEGLLIELPPLRERRADIVPLFGALLKRHASGAVPKLEAKLVERLCLEPWPMNVRELENTARRLLTLFGQEPELSLQQLLEVEGSRAPAPEPATSATRRSLPAYQPEELSALRAAIERHGGNLTRAADELGITRPKAYRMLRTLKPES